MLLLRRRVGRVLEEEAAGLGELEEAAETLMVLVGLLAVRRKSQARGSSSRRRRSRGGEAGDDDGEGLICSTK